LGFLLYSSIRISLIYTFIIIIVSFIKLVVPLSTKKINSKYDKEMREYKTNVQSYEFELMNQPHKIMMLGLTDPFIQRFHKIYLNFFKSTLKKKIRLLSLSLNTSNILDSFCTIIIILSGTILIAKEKISAGSIAIALGFLPVFKTLFQNISSIIRDCPVLFTLVDRLTMFYSNEEQTDGVVISNINNINVCNLSFSYNNEIVFQGLNFTIHQGDKIAICGKNGSGKTTLIKVLSGLLNKYSGKILIDGCELSEVKKNSLYNIIAYIEQDPYLFPIPFRDNIQIGNLNASENEFNEVVKKLQIGYLVNRVNCASDQLSGGEKQKISIARALLKKAPIIIMDEPTNNLDKDSKKWLIEFIKQSCETIIFVSHDSDLLSLANITITL
jgi:ABC-type bacteriocin/lantibiotic exporter with double-glycine peptidase domain